MSLRDKPCAEYVGEPEMDDGEWCNRCGWPERDHPAPHAFVDRSQVGYDCACGWSGTYSREVHFDTAAEQHRQHVARVLPPGATS